MGNMHRKYVIHVLKINDNQHLDRLLLTKMNERVDM